ncbi:MAG: NAD-dependent epimerase/dehydratase family protein [Phycisphaerales bacterium]
MLDWSTQRVIVTGGAGFLGRAVVAVLRARGVSDERMVVPRAAQCDLRRPEEARRLVAGAAHDAGNAGGVVVVHSAGLVGGLGLNRARPADMLHDNLLMGLNVIAAAAGVMRADTDSLAKPQESVAQRVAQPGAGIKVVIVGSMTSYPASAPLPYREESLFGGLPDPEIAAYGVAKLGLLAALRAYHTQYGLPSAFPILVNLYGPGDNVDDPLKSHAAGAIMKRFVDAARARATEVVCWGTGAPTRDFLFVDDAAEGVVRCAEEIDDASPINIASGQETSIKSLSETIARHAGYTGRIVWEASKGDGVGRRCLDITRARTRLNWSPRVPLDEGMRRTVEWYRQRRG